MVTLDTSGILALVDRRDPDHDSTRQALELDGGSYIVPAAILAEVTYFLERRHAPPVLDAFLSDVESGTLSLDCGEGDFARIRTLVGRYADLPLGFADASVIACAERNGGRVLTLDRRRFGVVAREGRITLLP